MSTKHTPDTLYRVAALALSDAAMIESRFPLYMKEFVDEMSRPEHQNAESIWRMIQDAPPALPLPALNAFLAGVAEFVAHRHDVEVPAWATDASRFLDRPVFWGSRPQTRSHMLVETPGPFRRRNLFCGYVELHSNRWDSSEIDNE